MFIVIRLKKCIVPAIFCLLALFLLIEAGTDGSVDALAQQSAQPSYIKWVDFTVPSIVLRQALKLDIESYQKAVHLNWIELLAYAAAKTGGKFKNKRNADIDSLAARLTHGESVAQITENMKYYAYYLKAYTAVLGGFVGEYELETPDKSGAGKTVFVKKYGLKVFSPVAKGYYYSHYNDFGVSRSYGYDRKHLGNDLIGSVGTPIVAVEGGVVEALGWNQYGGWRIGIRSFDGMRYYYYAHLRKNHPYVKTLVAGSIVKPGDVIGYLGMTGYSTRENQNNIKTPHLHFGMQLIFDESQKDGINQIWINVYHIVNFLENNRSAASYSAQTKDFVRIYDFFDGVTAD